MLKISGDLVFLMLLLLQLRFEPETHFPQEPEIRSVILGNTAAQVAVHGINSNYPHPKRVDEVTNLLFSRLNFYDTLRARTGRIIACIADKIKDEDNDTSPQTAGFRENERDSSYDAPELSPEDMDLIEILWKQDIDLGVSREAYDSRQCVEVEKRERELKSQIELTKEKDSYDDLEIPEEEPAHVPELPSGFNYTIDSETGEYVISDFATSLNEGDIFNDHLIKNDSKYLESGILKDNETVSPLSQDSYLPFDADVCDDFLDLSEAFSPTQMSQLLLEDISEDSDYLSQIENLGINRTLDESDGINSTAGDIYPSMEDCWPDATTMLPLLALGNTHQSSVAPLSPHSLNVYPNMNNNNNLPSPPQNRTNERFIGLLHNVSMEVPTAEEDFQPSAIGPSSIGCAVAESMAALTNDTDPLPTNSIINSAYNSEFPELLYTNHTVAVPHNELLISDLLLEEDLHFVSLTSNANEEKHNEEHMDTSSDSVSLTSGQLPSVSDYESESRNFSDAPFQQVNCNDQQYFSMKSYYSDISENCSSGGELSFSKKFDYAVPKPSAISASNLLNHNHSYHLPFTSEDPHFKPIMKDKLKYSSDEDACNKDEKRAKELKLPISINDIINLAIDEYNERLSKYELTDAQLTLIRDIRRRGKNKVAAQNCRKRKMDQISSLQQDLGFLQREKYQLQSKQKHLLHEKHHFENKYTQLYDLVLQTTNSKPPNPPTSIPLLRNTQMTHPINSQLLAEEDSDPSRGARTRRKLKK